MLSWALTFFVIALVAAVLGFGGIAGAAAGIAQILFFVFLVLFVGSLLFGSRLFGKRPEVMAATAKEMPVWMAARGRGRR